MTVYEFIAILRERRCWDCGAPTHASNLGQRQCPVCRRKLSYTRLARRWALAECYAEQRHYRSAASRTGVSRKTTLAMYARFRTTVRFSEGDLWKFVHPFKSHADQINPEAKRRVLRTLFEQIFEPTLAGSKHR